MLLEICKPFCNILRANGFEAYLVGGAVRDFVLGKNSDDIDIATNATPKEVTRIFKKEGYKIVPVGEKFGTVQIVGEPPVEITTYRSEGRYTDKRHPDSVKFETSLEKDLSRRDFTINAIAFDPIAYEYFDPFDGRADIENGIIRAVGNPEERFEEDPLRMLRMCRFGGKLGFILDGKTYNAATKLHALIKEIPVERVKEELLKILSTENIVTAMHYLNRSRLLGDILPEVAILEGVEQPKLAHKYDVYTHSVMAMSVLPKENPLLRLAGLLHDIGKTSPNPVSPYFPDHVQDGTKKLEAIFERLKMSGFEKTYISFMLAHHMDSFWNRGMRPNGARRYLSKIDDTTLLSDLRLIIRADIIGTGYDKPQALKEMEEFFAKLLSVIVTKQPFTKNDLAINGHDLMALGIPPSPKLGEIQEKLLDEVIEEPTRNTREYLLKRAGELK